MLARLVRAGVALACAALAGCSGSAGSGGVSVCIAGCNSDFLTEAEVQRIIVQAVAEAQARNVRAQVAVVDRVGNVLATYQMNGAPASVAISGGRGVAGGLDGIPEGVVPATHAAIAKAITGAYLSSQGNAFSTRTASQIIEEHFNPNERDQPSGPLYGVQFSQLTCSDVNRNVTHGSVGPKRSSLGLAADAGGLPLYKNGVLVGGIGIEANARYGLDRDITDVDQDDEELVAVAGSFGFAAPADIRADRITADGRTFRFVDSEAIRSDPSRAPAFATLPGALVAVDGFSAASVRAGTTFGSAASGMRADTGAFAASGGWILVDAVNANRFAPRDSSDGLLHAGEVQAILREGLALAKRARGQIRRPLGSIAEVSISVVGLDGDILGLTRTPDAPVFGIDVAVQKARTAMFFSHPAAAAELLAAAPAEYVSPRASSAVAAYVPALRAFLGDPAALTGSIAWSPRAVGNLHRPFYPDGIAGTPAGPLSKPYASWSPFNVGLQLDLVYNQLIKGVQGDLSEGCTGIRKLRNGAQIFPGGVPIYRGARLVGAVGVSGDGVDQDDMIAFLGLANAARNGASGIGNAPAAIRADTLTPLGVRLRYVQCPQSPFNDSSAENVCAGL
jgi:uncharacterized protein GlcG (DUF336 family)